MYLNSNMPISFFITVDALVTGVSLGQIGIPDTSVRYPLLKVRMCCSCKVLVLDEAIGDVHFC
jgi:hypothetical protein